MKEYLKWLVLIPILGGAIALGFLIPQWLSEDSGADSGKTGEQNQAVQLEITDKQQLVDQYQGLLETNAQDAIALKGLGDAYLEIGSLQNENGDINGAFRSFKSAADAYEQYLVIKPDDTEVRVDLGFTYFNMLMFEVAERELKVVTTAAPSNQRAWLVYGVILNRMEKTDEAVAAWQAAYNLDPNSNIGQEAKAFIDQAGSVGTLVPQGP